MGELGSGRVGEWGGVGWGGGGAMAAVWRHVWRGDVERRVRRVHAAAAAAMRARVQRERDRETEREREARPRAEGAEGADLCVQVSDAGHDLYEEPPRLGLAAPPVLHDVLK